MKAKLFRIAFLNQGKVYELYAGSVEPGSLPGFIDISDLRFGDDGRIAAVGAVDAINAVIAFARGEEHCG